MKIVNIEDVFFPTAGYQINILPKYLSKFGHEVYIITSEIKKLPEEVSSFFNTGNICEDDKKYEIQTGVRIIRLPIVAFKSGRAIFTKELLRTVIELRPDLLYVHGNDTLSAITFLRKASKYPFKIVTDSHMLDMASKNPFRSLFYYYYRKNITPVILKQSIPVIRTQNDEYVEKRLGIPLRNCPWISYGSDLLLFHPDKSKKNRFREEYNIPKESFVFLYAGKVDENKGGRLLAEAFQKRISDNKDCVLVIVGNLVGEYGKQVQEVLERSENRIIRFPTQQYNDLSYYFQISDAVVFAKQCSLSFYDAQACGNPVISEDNSINVERNSHGNGMCFTAGSVIDFRDKLRTVAELNDIDYASMSFNSYRFIKENYDYEEKAREYERILLNAIQ